MINQLSKYDYLCIGNVIGYNDDYLFLMTWKDYKYTVVLWLGNQCQ